MNNTQCGYTFQSLKSGIQRVLIRETSEYNNKAMDADKTIGIGEGEKERSWDRRSVMMPSMG